MTAHYSLRMQPKVTQVKRVTIAVGNGIGLVVAVPWIALARLGVLFGSNRLYVLGAYALCVLPGDPGVFVRRAFYRFTLASSTWSIAIHFGSVFTQPTARVGERVYVGSYCLLGTCRLEDDVIIGSRVSIPSGRRQHGIADTERTIADQAGVFEEVMIGRDAWVGEGAIVMASLGSKSVVGAGSVVVKPAPAGSVVVGNPARAIRSRDHTPPSEE